MGEGTAHRGWCHTGLMVLVFLRKQAEKAMVSKPVQHFSTVSESVPDSTFLLSEFPGDTLVTGEALIIVDVGELNILFEILKRFIFMLLLF